MSSPSPITRTDPEAERLVFIGLGSNLESAFGSPMKTVSRAFDELAEMSRAPLRRSSMWLSKPVDCPPGSGDFVNAVAGLRPRKKETPRSLLEKLQAIEARFGRRRTGRVNSPRTLDLDLICFAGLEINQAGLIVPHPQALKRAFVLLPLAEIAPSLVLPGGVKTVAELAAAITRCGQGVERVAGTAPH